MNHAFIIGDYPPSAVSKENSGAEGGTEELAARWWRMADTGSVGSGICVRMIEAPCSRVIFDHGMSKDANL
jgi:hypothetical protein